MLKDLYRGKLVRLTAEDPEILAQAMLRWNRDSEYIRLLDFEQARMWSMKKIKEWFEKDLEKDKPEEYFFQIRTLDEGTSTFEPDGENNGLLKSVLIGFVGLFGEFINHGDAWVGIGLGEREYWGKGYGTDAMRVILRYAFTELNLWRVTLGAFEYNPRAIRSYEKAGFSHEGRARKNVLRDGRRWDTLFMGILREEWEKRDDYD